MQALLSASPKWKWIEMKFRWGFFSFLSNVSRQRISQFVKKEAKRGNVNSSPPLFYLKFKFIWSNLPIPNLTIFCTILTPCLSVLSSSKLDDPLWVCFFFRIVPLCWFPFQNKSDLFLLCRSHYFPSRGDVFFSSFVFVPIVIMPFSNIHVFVFSSYCLSREMACDKVVGASY